MPRRTSQHGQSTVELIGLLPALVLLGLLGWQLASAAYAWTLAGGAARASARAAEVGAPADDAARAGLPAGYGRTARVRVLADGRVRVGVGVARVLPLVPLPKHVEATAAGRAGR